MTIIEKIKAEIERLKGICTAQIKANPGQTFPFVMEMTGYDKLLSFLSTLESEKPMNLEEEIKKEMVKLPFFIRGKDQIAFARHFAEWGYQQGIEKGKKQMTIRVYRFQPEESEHLRGSERLHKHD